MRSGGTQKDKRAKVVIVFHRHDKEETRIGMEA
jgi:hypothetical protein